MSETREPARDAAVGPLTRAPGVRGRAHLSAVRRELSRRRLRLNDLPPLPRRLGRFALAFTLVAAAIVAAWPLIETGSGYFPYAADGGAVPTNITALGVIFVFVGTAFAFGLAAYAAPARLRRVAAAGVAVAGFAMLPTDLGGGLGGLGLDPALTTEWPLATWAMFAALSAVAILLSAAVLGLPRSRHTLGFVSAVPPICTLVIVVVIARVEVPETIFGDQLALGRLATSEALLGASALAGLFAALGVWAVIEYTKMLGTSGARTLALGRSWWWVIPVLAAVKLAWIAAASAGWLPAGLAPDEAPLGIIARESPLSLGLAAAFVAVVALAAARRWLRPHSAEVATGVFWLLVIPILAGYVLPTLAIKVLAAAHRFALRLHQPVPAEWAPYADRVHQLYTDSLAVVERGHDVLLAGGPLIAALTAIAVAIYQLKQHPHRAAAAPFLLGYGLWTLVPAITFAAFQLGAPVWDVAPTAEGGPSLLGNVNPITIDFGLTVVILVVGLIALGRGARPIAPPLLLALLAVSTLAAYVDQLTPPAFAVALFWIGLAFPVFFQFGLDAAALNRPGPARGARVLFALAAALLALTSTYLALIVGEAGPEQATTAALVRQLTLMPLALTFVLAAARRRDAREERTATGIGDGRLDIGREWCGL